MNAQAFFLFCSPAGTTRRAIGTIASILSRSMDTCIVDVADQAGLDGCISRLRQAGPGDCLFIGSPVYRDMAVPPVLQALDSLPSGNGCGAVPVVTWGGAHSGIALWQLGRALAAKNYRLVGAAKVLAQHSMMWAHPEPVGKGRPGPEEETMLARFAGQVAGMLAEGSRSVELPLESLAYHGPEQMAELRKKLEQPWSNLEKTVDASLCTQCGTCADSCPVDAIELADVPSFGTGCFDCFQCVKLCPEEAISSTVPMGRIHEMILGRVESIAEQPRSQVFLP